MEEILREREKPQKLRVIFPDGETLCFTSSKETFIQTLRRISIDRLSAVDSRRSHGTRCQTGTQ